MYQDLRLLPSSIYEFMFAAMVMFESRSGNFLAFVDCNCLRCYRTTVKGPRKTGDPTNWFLEL